MAVGLGLALGAGAAEGSDVSADDGLVEVCGVADELGCVVPGTEDALVTGDAAALGAGCGGADCAPPRADAAAKSVQPSAYRRNAENPSRKVG